jgi:alkanesulfonate monooxygenase SsuD/methylene tetrahydromethanopterin reductase-like flavin-dependent oxidoreductase (luciferase family)
VGVRPLLLLQPPSGYRSGAEQSRLKILSAGSVSTFLVEHHFTGFGQVSATLNLLTWIGAHTTTLRLGTAVLVLPYG